MKDLKGKIALITGGASGIGLATAKELITLGTSVMIFDVNPEGITTALDELKVCASESQHDVWCDGIQGDVTNFESVQYAISNMESKNQPIDLLITCAGIAHPGPISELDVGIIKKTIDIDLLGTIYTCRAVIPGMIRRGGNTHIAVVSSIAGLLGVYGYAAYGAAKYGVRGFGEVMRQELKPENIGITILYPPDTDTPQFEYENQFKPEETRAIAGTIKPVSAEYVAKCLIKGIRKNRFQVTPTFTGKITGVAAKMFTPILRFFLDSTVKKVRKNKK